MTPDINEHLNTPVANRVKVLIATKTAGCTGFVFNPHPVCGNQVSCRFASTSGSKEESDLKVLRGPGPGIGARTGSQCEELGQPLLPKRTNREEMMAHPPGEVWHSDGMLSRHLVC